MIFLVNFIVILARILDIAILVRILMSWMPTSTSGGMLTTIHEIIHSITEPILRPIRQLVPPVGGLDLSPMIAIILIQVITGIFTRMI